MNNIVIQNKFMINSRLIHGNSRLLFSREFSVNFPKIYVMTYKTKNILFLFNLLMIPISFLQLLMLLVISYNSIVS